MKDTRRLFLGGNRLVVKAENSGDTAAAAGFGVFQGIGVAGLAIRTLHVALLAMFRDQIGFDAIGVTPLADFRFGGDGASRRLGGRRGPDETQRECYCADSAKPLRYISIQHGRASRK